MKVNVDRHLDSRRLLIAVIVAVALTSLPAYAGVDEGIEAMGSMIEDMPVPWFTFTPAEPKPGELITLDASRSQGEGGILSYQWDVTGDGRTDRAGVQVRTTFDEPGVYDVTLTVHDGLGRAATLTRRIRVGSPGGVVVSIKTDPPGFIVFIDGVRRGQTPVELVVEPGFRLLRLRHYWLSDWQTTLDLRNVKSLGLDLTFE